jgi:hypothetical protein
MRSVENRELTEQRTHGAAMPNKFHCNLPTLNIHRLFCRLRKSHYDYAKEPFWLSRLDFLREITETAWAYVIGDKVEQRIPQEKRRQLTNAWTAYREPLATGHEGGDAHLYEVAKPMGHVDALLIPTLVLVVVDDLESGRTTGSRTVWMDRSWRPLSSLRGPLIVRYPATSSGGK